MTFIEGFSGGSAVKNLLVNAGDVALIFGSGRSLEKGLVTHPNVLDWEIPWKEEPGSLQSMRSQESDTM